MAATQSELETYLAELDSNIAETSQHLDTLRIIRRECVEGLKAIRATATMMPSDDPMDQVIAEAISTGMVN